MSPTIQFEISKIYGTYESFLLGEDTHT